MLSDEIDATYRKGVLDGPRSPYFVPEGELERLVDKTSVTRDFPQLPEKTVTWILEKGRKVFAITIQVLRSDPDRLKALAHFAAVGFDNSCIPITRDPISEADDDDEPAMDWWEMAFEKEVWGRGRRIDFYREQWRYIAPVFEAERFRYDLSAQHLLPAIWKDDTAPEGGFATVHKVEMHPSHQKLATGPDGKPYKALAVKALNLSGFSSEADDTWEREAVALSHTNIINHKHIIKCLAAVHMGDKRYFIFPWADGGTLRDYWNESPQHSRRAKVVKEAVEQLYGLSGALLAMHQFNGDVVEIPQESVTAPVTIMEPESEEHQIERGPDGSGGSDQPRQGRKGVDGGGLRHGDLKPENILRFIEDGTDRDSELCTLKIADMGLAKRHILATRERNGATTTIYTSRQYEAPERDDTKPLSRLYDVWSMGCIILDYIIWLLYGNKELQRFNKEIRNGNTIPRYFDIPEGGAAGDGSAVVSPGVKRWVDFIQQHDPECRNESAIGDLLRLIQENLLVPSECAGSKRWDASMLEQGLGKILIKMASKKEHEYTLTATDLSTVKTVPLPPKGQQILVPDTANDAPPRFDYGTPDRQWYLPIDNVFAKLPAVKALVERLQPTCKPAQLCERCSHLNFWAADFKLMVSVSKRTKKCNFCQMLSKICQDNSVITQDVMLVLRRDKSVLKVEGKRGRNPPPPTAAQTTEEGTDPVISLCKDPALRLDSIQIGLPQLPELGTAPGDQLKDFLELPRQWLEDCDQGHQGCRAGTVTRLPTRLISVGKSTADVISLYETTEADQEQHRRGRSDQYSYVALSHRWGDPRECEPFRTLPGETHQRFKKEIPWTGEDGLPATFKDAVEVTRALEKAYLWIDSICILQGPNGDFQEEAKRMEDVFSSAYCVIAASRAAHQRDGFLKARMERKFLKFDNGGGKPFYACEPIDDFKRHVLDGPLNRRGWVLQERALARRTVYFTEVQTYFECGEGVRCETLSKIRQTETEFLGDPNFPDKIKTMPRGIKIRDFTGLYKTYSRLELSRHEDRPRAIQGLETRLGSAYDAQVRFGIFDDGPNQGFLHRSLLWRRADDAAMSPITFPEGTHRISVPSWSWMGLNGAIDYFNPEGNQYEWEQNDIHPPWSQTAAEARVEADQLQATARRLNLGQPRDLRSSVWYDMQLGVGPSVGDCVVVATQKPKAAVGDTARTEMYYILLVSPSGETTATGREIYRRIGAGHVHGSCISWDALATAAVIE